MNKYDPQKTEEEDDRFHMGLSNKTSKEWDLKLIVINLCVAGFMSAAMQFFQYDIGNKYG